MVIMTILVTANQNKRKEFLSALHFYADKTGQIDGCRNRRIYQDIEDENIFRLEETWVNRSNLDEHFRSDIFSALLGAIKLLGKIYEIRIKDGLETEGIDGVKNARSKKE